MSDAAVRDGKPLRGQELLAAVMRGDVTVGDDRIPRWTKRTPPPTTPTPAPVRDADGCTKYGLNALRDECSQVAAAAEGTRNDALNKAAYRMGRLVPEHLDAEVVRGELETAGRSCGLPQTEIDLVLRDDSTAGITQGQTAPRTVEPLAAVPEPTIFTDPESGQQVEVTRESRLLLLELENQRARREAKRLLDAEEAAKSFREPPYRPTLTEELAIPDEPVTYTVDELLPTGGNVLLTAQFKTGKTTFINELAGSLADGTKFLDRFPVESPDGRIALFNYEVDDRQYRRWLRDKGIHNTDNIVVLNLRGYRLPITVPSVEDWTVKWLRQNDVKVWMVDPFARAFTGCGASENDNSEVGVFLDTLDVIKMRAGVSDLILPTHTGRADFEPGEERARGATRLDDWADVRWFLTKDEGDVRFFRATGRDVEVGEGKLTFDESTRSLTLGGGDRAWEKRKRAEDIVVQVVTDQPGVGVTALREAFRRIGGKGKNEFIDSAIAGAKASHKIRAETEGSGTALRHYPMSVHVLNGEPK